MKKTGIHSAAFPQSAASSEYHTGLTKLEVIAAIIYAGACDSVDDAIDDADSLITKCEACAREEGGEGG